MNLCLHLSVGICRPPQTPPRQDRVLFLLGQTCHTHDLSRTLWCCWIRLPHAGGKELLDWMTRCPLLPASQHQEDTSIPHLGGSTSSDPGSAHLVPGLLRLTLGWCACMCHPSIAAHPECSRPASLQPNKVLSYYTAPLHLALANKGSLNLI